MPFSDAQLQYTDDPPAVTLRKIQQLLYNISQTDPNVSSLAQLSGIASEGSPQDVLRINSAGTGLFWNNRFNMMNEAFIGTDFCELSAGGFINAGQYGNQSSGAGSSNDLAQPVAGDLAVGIHRAISGTANSGRAGFDTWSSIAQWYFANGGIHCQSRARIFTTLPSGSGSANAAVRIGGFTNGGTITNNVIGFEFDPSVSANWRCRVRTSGSDIANFTTDVAATTNWTLFDINISPLGVCTFKINNQTVYAIGAGLQTYCVDGWGNGVQNGASGTTPYTLHTDWHFVRQSFSQERV